jgi:hypothetical protein
MSPYSKIDFNVIFIASMLLTFGVVGYLVWMRERRYRVELQKKQDERENKRLELEERRLHAQEHAQYEAGEREEQRLTAEKAGTGSGGYIVMDMPEKDRPFFHDLLKGFEDYARLKGYHIAFSIDSSFNGRIAFKFTILNDGFVVGPERVRQDFKDYLNQVRNGQVDDLDDLPVITSLEEHNLLITHLKNRIVFLQHSYQLSQNATKFYETLLASARTFPALPAASVIVQTGGNMDSRKYNAVNSPRLIQGDSNTFIDSSVNIDIGQSFNERQERISALDDVIKKLKSSKVKDESVHKARRELGKVRDELAEYPEPDKSSVKKWMEYAKQLMSTAALGVEVVEAGKKLFAMFGM